MSAECLVRLKKSLLHYFSLSLALDRPGLATATAAVVVCISTFHKIGKPLGTKVGRHVAAVPVKNAIKRRATQTSHVGDHTVAVLVDRSRASTFRHSEAKDGRLFAAKRVRLAPLVLSCLQRRGE